MLGRFLVRITTGITAFYTTGYRPWSVATIFFKVMGPLPLGPVPFLCLSNLERMATEYSSGTIIAARSLQTYTVRRFLHVLLIQGQLITICYQYMYSACYPSRYFLVLTQLKRPWLHSGYAYSSVFQFAIELVYHPGLWLHLFAQPGGN